MVINKSFENYKNITSLNTPLKQYQTDSPPIKALQESKSVAIKLPNKKA